MRNSLDLMLNIVPPFHHFRAHLDILKSNGVGMDDPLVDSEDFPRNDIDVYQVNIGSLYTHLDD